MYRNFLTFLMLMALPFCVQAQLKGGFKTGLNFSTIKGPVQSLENGEETFSSATGFHVGPILSLPITESFGVRAEILYNQAGTKYNFKGDGFQIFTANDDSRILANGPLNINLKITNTYLTIPIIGYVRAGSFELNGGFNFGMLLSSTGDGNLIFSGITEGGTQVDEFNQIQFYNYLKDDPGEANFTNSTDVLLDNKVVEIPDRVGAYYMETEKSKMYKFMDLGLNVGASYYINKTLYIGARANWGMSDISNNDVDFNRIKTEGLDILRQTDKDTNFQFQISIGFSL